MIHGRNFPVFMAFEVSSEAMHGEIGQTAREFDLNWDTPTGHAC